MARSLRDILNEGEQGKVGNANQFSYMGSMQALAPRHTGQAVVTSSVIVLPNNAKAVRVIEAFGVTGTVTGQFTPVPQGVPATTQVSTNPAGDIVFAAADAVTLAEVTYLIAEGQIITDLVQVVSSNATLLGNRAGRILIAASVLTGVAPGAVTPAARSAAAAATTTAKLSLSGLIVNFNAAQVVTGTASVTYVAVPSVGSALTSLGLNLDAQTQNW